jgi:tetratricopeptide (TPR) repeat protein
MEKVDGVIIETLAKLGYLIIFILLLFVFLLLAYLLFVYSKKFFNKNRSVYIDKSMEIKSPSLSAILSFIIPGLGQIKNGEILRGITYLIMCVILSSLILFAYALTESEFKIITTVFAIILSPLLLYVYIDNIRDAYRTALIIKRKSKPERKIASNINRESVSDILKRGRTLYSSGNYQAAIDAFSNAIDLDPNYGTAYYNRGVVYYKLSKYLEAGNDFIAAAKLGHKKAQKVLKSEGVSYGEFIEMESENA